MSKLLVSDYDGTLYTDDENIKINCDLLRRFIRNGNFFVLSSGRSLESLIEKVQEYNIPFTHLSCCDGSFLYDNQGRLLFACPVSHEAVEIFKKLQNLKKHKKVEFAYPEFYSSKYIKNNIIGSVAVTLDEEKIDDTYIKTFEKIKEEHPEYQYDIYKYGGEVYYLIRPHGVSKATPIKYLQNELRISCDDIYTIGDNTNDRELIRDYNGYRIGDNKDIVDVSLKEYGSVHELISDIENKKVLKRW